MIAKNQGVLMEPIFQSLKSLSVDCSLPNKPQMENSKSRIEDLPCAESSREPSAIKVSGRLNRPK